MKRGKILDAEDLRNLSGTLIDVAGKFRNLSAPIDCRDLPRSIVLLRIMVAEMKKVCYTGVNFSDLFAT